MAEWGGGIKPARKCVSNENARVTIVTLGSVLLLPLQDQGGYVFNGVFVLVSSIKKATEQNHLQFLKQVKVISGWRHLNL